MEKVRFSCPRNVLAEKASVIDDFYFTFFCFIKFSHIQVTAMPSMHEPKTFDPFLIDGYHAPRSLQMPSSVNQDSKKPQAMSKLQLVVSFIVGFAIGVLMIVATKYAHGMCIKYRSGPIGAAGTTSEMAALPAQVNGFTQILNADIPSAQTIPGIGNANLGGADCPASKSPSDCAQSCRVLSSQHCSTDHRMRRHYKENVKDSLFASAEAMETRPLAVAGYAC
jgi:hypothetical protein